MMALTRMSCFLSPLFDDHRSTTSSLFPVIISTTTTIMMTRLFPLVVLMVSFAFTTAFVKPLPARGKWIEHE